MTSSNGNIFRVTGHLCGRSPVNSPHKGQWRRALMFSVICAWINGWVNNLEAGDLKRHCAHYCVSVMFELTYVSWRLHWVLMSNFVKHGKSPLADRQEHCVLMVADQSWRHNADACELSANHTLRCITLQVHETSQQIIRCNAYAVWQWKQYGGRRRSCRELSSAS